MFLTTNQASLDFWNNWVHKKQAGDDKYHIIENWDVFLCFEDGKVCIGNNKVVEKDPIMFCIEPEKFLSLIQKFDVAIAQNAQKIELVEQNGELVFKV